MTRRFVGTYGCFALFFHRHFEDIEHALETLRCVDVVKAFVSDWRSLIAHHRHFLDKRGCVLLKVFARNVCHIENPNLTSDHKIIIVSHQDFIHHCRYFRHVLDRVIIRIVVALSYKEYSR